MKIYLVGGAIRNQLLDLPVQDRDWVVVGSTPEKLLKLNFKQVGKDFPVFLHPKSKEEYSLARIERKINSGYTGFSTNYSDKVTLQEDLMRRDLTINAIAQDDQGSYIDPYGGMKDIQNRILRHVSSAFSEDPLRVLRVARFCSLLHHLGFKIAMKTIKLMSTIVKKNNELLSLTRDRIWKETEKALITNNPHVYFRVLHSCHALSIIFPEISFICKNQFCYASNIYNIFDNTRHIFMDLAKISMSNKEVDIRFSYLFFCIIRILFPNFDNYSLSLNSKILTQFMTNLFKRFLIPVYIQRLSIFFSRFYKFLSVIHYQSSKDIVFLFNCIDAWRKPYIIKKLSILNNFYLKNCMSKVDYSNYPKNFLEDAFNFANKVSVKPILNSGFVGLNIKNELIRLRIIAVDTWKNHLKTI